MSVGGGAAARLAAVGPAFGAARREGARAEASADAGPAFELDIDARPADAGHLRDGARAHERGERIPGRDDTRRVMSERDDARRDTAAAGDAGRPHTADATAQRAPGASGSEPGRHDRRIATEPATARARDPRQGPRVPTDQDAPRNGAGTPEAGGEAAPDPHADASLPEHMLALLSGEWQSTPVTPGPQGADAGVVSPAAIGLDWSLSMVGAPALSGPPRGEVAPAHAAGSDAAPSVLRAAPAHLVAAASAPSPTAALLPAATASAGDVPALTTAATVASTAQAASPHPVLAAGSAAPVALPGPTGAGSATAHVSADALVAAFAIAPQRTDDTATASSIEPALAPIGDTPFALPLAAGGREVTTLLRAPEIVAPVPMPADPEAGFDDAFGSRIVWMAEQRLGHAELRVSPGQLGAIDIRLELDGNRVNAQFNAGNAEVRQALEAGMDRLRDLLGRQGMELAQSSVGGERRQSGGDGARGAADTGPTSDAGAPDDAPVTLRTLRARGLVDEYA